MSTGKFFLVIVIVGFMICVGHADVILTVNGYDPTLEPLNCDARESIVIGLSSASPAQKNLDASLQAIGGMLQQSNSKQISDNILLTVESSGNSTELFFTFADGAEGAAAVVNLVTNIDTSINGLSAKAGTTIYQLILFPLVETQTVIVFGANYESLSYTPEAQEQTADKAIDTELAVSQELQDWGSEPTILSMQLQQAEPVWFDHASECPDLDGDKFVNFGDFVIFAQNWLLTGSNLEGDFNQDGTVGTSDLLHFCQFWLMEVDYPSYYADPLPYSTSFEEYQGFEYNENLDYQGGWQVVQGDSHVGGWWAYDYDWYQYVYVTEETVITKQFEDSENNHQFIHINFIPAVDQKVNIRNNSQIVASVWFAPDWKIYVLKNGAYVNTNIDYQNVYNECWYYFWDLPYYNGADHYYDYTWTTLKFKMDWYSNRYEVYWDGGSTDIANLATFSQNYDTLTAVEIVTTDDDWGVINSIAIGDWTSERPQVTITSPCACDTDTDLKGRVPIIGTAEGNNFGGYDLYFCPIDLALTPQGQLDWDNWQHFAEGTNVVNNGILGYWDTSSIPNGYYYLAVVVLNDLGYWEGWPQVVYKTLTIGSQVVYEGPGHFAVVGDLKCNTFYHQEEPDISVPWAGQFPFEFRRFYNNNRRFYSEPLRNGWSHNHHIALIEDCTYHWQLKQSVPFEVPSWDHYGLGKGDIWVTYPDGSRQLFRHTAGYIDDDPVVYRPYPEDNSGDYIKRETIDDGWGTVERLNYILHRRDGSFSYFWVDGLSLPEFYGHLYYTYGRGYGTVGWKVEAGIYSSSDRFGNTLVYSWNYDKTAVTAVTDGRATITLDMENGYYTQARLVVGQDTLRTVQFTYTTTPEPVFTVTRIGKGVNEQGVYDASSNKEYKTKYLYDEEKNLRQIVNRNNLGQDETLIEIDYDNYGRVGTRRDFVEADKIQETTYTYTFSDLPEVGQILTTQQITPEQTITMVQNKNGATLSRQIVTTDKTAVTNTSLLYNDGDNVLKPTDVFESFDGLVRHTINTYNGYGDPIEQQVYVDEENYVATEISYHPSYSFETAVTRWQDFNATGPKVETLRIYGNADGTESETGAYLVKEKVLLDEGDPEDPQDDIWAITSYEYEDVQYKKGLVKKITDPEGFVTLIEYDTNGYQKLVKKGTATTAEPVQRFYYDAIGQLILEATPRGEVTRNWYDGFGKLYLTRKYEDTSVMSLSDVQFVPNRYDAFTVVAESKFGYNERGHKTYDLLQTGGQVSTTFTRSGQPKRATFDDGSFVEFGYDTRGNKVQESRYEYATQNDWYVTFVYDSMDRLTETNWFDYDDTELVKRHVSEYYGTGQKKVDEYYGYSGTLEKKINYGYDVLTRLRTSITDPATLALTTSYEYDAAGNRISTTDPKGSIIYSGYDNANRHITSYFAAESQTLPENAVLREEIAYYDNNKIFSKTQYDYNGSTVLSDSEYLYDGRDRLRQVTQQIDDTRDAVTIYDYSDTGFGAGNAYHIRITDAENKDTWIALNYVGKRTKVLYPSGDYEEYQYYGDGSLWKKAVWDATSTKQWIIYSYDGYGRLLTTTYPDTDSVVNLYDGFGRKTLVEDNRNATDNIGGNGELAYQYDVLNRLVSYTNHEGYVVSYVYRHDGQKQGIVVDAPGTPSTRIYDAQYNFDSANRLEYVWDGIADLIAGCIARFEYDDNGNRQVLRYYPSGSYMGSTVNLSYSYNRDNYLTGYSTTGGPTFSFDASQSGNIDGLGRLWGAAEVVTDTNSTTISRTYSYEYDTLSQLTYAYASNVAPTPAREHTYEYDKAGNITHSVFNNYSPDQEHHTYYGYTGDLQTGSGAQTSRYDGNGRQISMPETTPGTRPIEYDWNGKVRWHEESPGLGMEAKYTPDGIRIWKKFNWNLASYEHKYIVDIAGDVPQVLLVLDADNSNQIIKMHVHANGQVLALYDGNQSANRYLYLHDRLGSVRALMDSSAVVQNCYYYTPWGSPTGSETHENVENWYAWAGYWFEDGMYSGLNAAYYCNARNYTSGRFLTRDPVKGYFNEPMTLHQYLYCLNNPIDRIDPDGKFSLWMRAKEAGVKVGLLGKLRHDLHGGLTALNAFRGGMINMMTGPSTVSDSKLFAIGATSGAIEMQLGLKFGAAVGSTAGSAVLSTLNQAFANDPFFTWQSAGQIGLETLTGFGMGRFADWYDHDTAKGALELFMLGLDKDLIMFDIQEFIKLFR